MTKPSRSRSNGREARSGSSLRVLSAFTANNDSEAISSPQLLDFDPAVLECHFRRCHSELCKTIRAPDVFWIFEELLWIEVLDCSGDLAVVSGRIERLDSANSADPIFQIRPKRLHVVTNRRDGAQPSDDDSAIGHSRVESGQ